MLSINPYLLPICISIEDIKKYGLNLLFCLCCIMPHKSINLKFFGGKRFGKRFEWPLLVQSILMNMTMLALINLCVRVNNRNAPIRTHHTFLDFDYKYFWNWTDFQSYVDFVLIFSVIGSAITYLLFNSVAYIEGLGFLAVFTEAMLGLPQLLKNFKNKSTQGMSVSMVVMWSVGDLMKTIYFLERDAPQQFLICGIMQILIDVIILLQIGLYKRDGSDLRRD